MRILFTLSFLTLTVLPVYAQQLKASISYSTFYSQENGTYLETYFSIDANSITLEEIEDQRFQGAVELSVFIYKNDLLVGGDKIRMMSPVFEKKTDNFQSFVSQLRFQLVENDYLIMLKIKDINNEAEDYEIDFPVTIAHNTDTVSFSDVQLLDSFSKSAPDSKISKAGYDLIPLVPDGEYFFNPEMNKLSFYAEIYNSNLLVEGETFLVKTYILDALKNRIISKFVSYKKMQAAKTILPILQSFDIEDLETGTYTLNLEILDKNNQLINSKHILFYRDKKEKDFEMLASEEIDDILAGAGREFYSKIADIDTLKEYVLSLYSISTPRENAIASTWLESDDLGVLQQFFINFWKSRNSGNPIGAWEEYKKQVDYVHKKYGTRVLPGHRTDRGRVLLQYGQPSLVEDRRNEPSSYPFEIWQYNQLQSASTVPQTNRIFVFANYNLGTKDYRLIHSDAIGELQDPRWKLRLVKRDFQTNNIDETGNFNQSDLPGSRINNNIIMQGSSSMGAGSNPR